MRAGIAAFVFATATVATAACGSVPVVTFVDDAGASGTSSTSGASGTSGSTGIDSGVDGCHPTAEICDDGIDNDCDGKIDCAERVHVRLRVRGRLAGLDLRAVRHGDAPFVPDGDHGDRPRRRPRRRLGDVQLRVHRDGGRRWRDERHAHVHGLHVRPAGRVQRRKRVDLRQERVRHERREARRDRDHDDCSATTPATTSFSATYAKTIAPTRAVRASPP